MEWQGEVTEQKSKRQKRMAEQAMETARQAEIDIVAGDYRGPLHGVPVAVKDLCYTWPHSTDFLALLHIFDPWNPLALKIKQFC